MHLRACLQITTLMVAGMAFLQMNTAEVPSGGLCPDAVEFHIYRDPVEQERAAYSRDALALLHRAEYEALEVLARRARDGKERFADGSWKLQRFYGAFPLATADSAAAWEQRLAQIEAWMESRPKSITPAIALAEVWAAYGAKAHAAEPRSEAGRERLEAALRILENARSLGVNDPHYWKVARAVAVGLEWPAANAQMIYDEAMALEPAYWSSVLAHIPAMLAKERRAPETIHLFAHAVAATAGDSEEIIYARMAWEANEVAGGFLEEMPFDWPRVQAGYRALLKKFPDSPGLLSQYCVLACRARDKAAARKCLAKLGGQADLRAFKTTREYSRHARWAYWN